MIDPEMYVMLDSRLDVFGGASSLTPFTVAYFAYLEDYGRDVVWQFGTTSTTTRWNAWVPSCGLKFEFITGDKKLFFKYCAVGQSISINIVSPEILELGKWQHVAVTYDQTKVRFYANGVMRNEQSYTIALSANPVYVKLMLLAIFFVLLLLRLLINRISNLCRIFRLRGVHKMFGGGPIFRGGNEILLLGRALKFGVIFQKYALKLIEIEKY